MGSVFKQKSGKWGIRFDVPADDGSRKQKQIGGFAKKQEADKELTKIEASILSGDFFQTANAGITVSQFLEIWIKDHVSPNLAPATLDFYQGLYDRHCKAYFSKILLVELKANQIDRFYSYLKTGTDLSINSIHHYHKMLRTALNKAVKWDYIKASPMAKATAPKQEKKEMNYWTEKDILKAMNVFIGTSIDWHVRVALLTGLRQGEIGALNEKNIDYGNKTFRITETVQRLNKRGIIFKAPKTEKSAATLPLTKELEELFRNRQRWIKINRLQFANKYNHEFDGYLSVWDDGHIMDPKYIGREFHRILKEHDQVPMIRFHDLRHSCATWLISQGVDLKTIQEILRHADFSTTANVYGHVSVEDKKQAMGKLKLGV